MRRWSRADRLALAGLVALPLLWYFTPLFTDACSYLDDVTAQYAPWWTYAHESLRAGRFPLWNPYVFGGMPYHVNPENSLFYPLKLPLFVLSFYKAAAVLRALNAIVASVGAYLLLRSYGTRPLSGALGALMFSYGSFMAYETVHIPYINTAVWFPWQLLFLERLIRRGGLAVSLALALVTATSFLGGSPGVFVICQMTLAVFLAARLIRMALAGRWTRMTRVFAHLTLSVAAVVGLTLVLLWPALQFIGFTPRSGGLQELDSFSDLVLIPEALGTMLFPWTHLRYGAPYPPIYPIFFLYVPYLGVGAVLLALFNLGSRRHAALVPVAVSVCVFGIVMAMGTRTAFFPWMFEHAPFVRWFRWPVDYLLMPYLVMWILAATGFDQLCRARAGRARRLGWLAAAYVAAGLVWSPHAVSVAAAIVVACLIALCGLVRGTSRADRPLMSHGLLPSLFASSARTHARGPVARRSLAAAVLLLVAADLFVYGSEFRVYLPRNGIDMHESHAAIEYLRRHAPDDRVAFSTPSAGTHFQGIERVFSRHIPLAEDLPERNRERTDFSRWLRRVQDANLRGRLWQRRVRFDNLENAFWEYPANASMIFRYQEISGYDPFAIDRVRRLFRTLPFGRTWALFGVTYVVAPNRILLDRLELAHEEDGLLVYRNRGALPRTMVPGAVEDGLAEEAVLDRLRSDGFDPRERVLFEDALDSELKEDAGSAGPPGPAGDATIVAYEPERVSLQADMKRAGFLVLHDVHYPGWKAYVDGRETEVRRANYVFRAVHLTAGRHRVEFVYRPASFMVSAWISGLSWIACLSALAVPALRARRAVAQGHES